MKEGAVFVREDIRFGGVRGAGTKLYIPTPVGLDKIFVYMESHQTRKVLNAPSPVPRLHPESIHDYFTPISSPFHSCVEA